VMAVAAMLVGVVLQGWRQDRHAVTIRSLLTGYVQDPIISPVGNPMERLEQLHERSAMTMDHSLLILARERQSALLREADRTRAGQPARQPRTSSSRSPKRRFLRQAA
jgi:hypothetical protein